MNKKILVSMMVIGLVATLTGAGLYAYFSDKETSTGNVFQAGTIDLKLFGNIPFEFYDIKPCENLSSVIVEFRNIGDFDGYLYNKITYVNKDKATNPTPLTADEFAALIYIKNVTYEHYTPTGGWSGVTRNDLDEWLTMDKNDDKYVSLYEIKLAGWMPYDVSDPEEPLLAGDRGRWNITFHMADSMDPWLDTADPEDTGKLKFDVLDNRPQADGIEMTWTAVLKQTPGPPA